MIQVCFEKLHENWPECVLQIDAFILIGQFIDVNIDRMNKTLDQIRRNSIVAVRLFVYKI